MVFFSSRGGPGASPLSRGFFILIKTAVLLGILSLFWTSGLRQDAAHAENAEPTREEMLNLFGEIYDLIKDNYVEQTSDKQLIYDALSGMLSGLDPHTSFLTEEDLAGFNLDALGRFGGLGLRVDKHETFIRVVNPIEDTPASKAGLQAEDLITHLDGASLEDVSLEEAVDRMRGEVGTTVTLTILRGDAQFDVTLERAQIPLPTVVHRSIDETIGYIRIVRFNANTTRDVERAVEALHSRPQARYEGFILDLRDNPGGLLSQALSVSDRFLDRGEIVSTRGRTTPSTRRYFAKKGDVLNGAPLVLLVNAGSASAAEIVAGALQDHRRGLVVGVRSFGKGSVQRIFEVRSREGAGLKLTVQKYFTPSGTSIQGEGIIPDVIVAQARPQPQAAPDQEDGAAAQEDGAQREEDLDNALPNASPEEASDEASEGDVEDEAEAAEAADEFFLSTSDIIGRDKQLERALELLRATALLKK